MTTPAVDLAGIDLDEIHRFVAQTAIAAGSYLRDHALARARDDADDLDITIKENAADLVTKADTHAEGMIMEAIRKQYPNYKVIGEESYSQGQDKRFLLDDDPTFIVDPLDGTVNFVHMFPMFCVSIGFCVQGVPVAGAIFAPCLGGLHPTNSCGYLYSAAYGKGAWSTPISFPTNEIALLSDGEKPWKHAAKLPYLPPAPLPPDAPKGCLFAGEWGKARSDSPTSNLTKKVNTFWNMAAEVGGRNGKGGMVHGIRSLGSASMDMVYVATGAVDIWLEGGCWEWDVCAGIILIREAGGVAVHPYPPKEGENASPLRSADLGSRLYLAIRPCRKSATESIRESQERLIKEVWKRAERLDYIRPT